MTGMRIGRLVMVRIVGRGAKGSARWLCQCDCGETCERDRSSLLHKGTPPERRSCGCMQRASASKLMTAMNASITIQETAA